MSAGPRSGVGRRIAYYRRIARLSQRELAAAAHIHIGTLRKIEQGSRGVGDNVLEAIAAALRIDPSRLLADREQASSRLRASMPALSAAIAAYDLPDDGPVRPVPELRTAVEAMVNWRLAAQYVQIVRHAPDLLAELLRGLHTAPPSHKAELARLVVAACRAADAVAYKFGAFDLSARFIEADALGRPPGARSAAGSRGGVRTNRDVLRRPRPHRRITGLGNRHRRRAPSRPRAGDGRTRSAAHARRRYRGPRR